jgi:dTDP-4-dehydrorhamnose reductase
MRVLILGGAGMLGHKLTQRLRERFDVWVTLRRPVASYGGYGMFDPARTVDGVDVANVDSLVDAVRRARPAVIVNAIGIVKQLAAAHDPMTSISINALLPHRLAALGAAAGARVIHVSTDCVFSGRKGGYTEDDPSDAEDLYGRSKYLGEIGGDNSLTLRTSVIGRELSGATGLVEWFLKNRDGAVKGFTRAVYSGVTTEAFAAALSTVMTEHPHLSGVYQLASTPITKYELLCLLRDGYGTTTSIAPEPEPVIDRSLNGARFRAATGYVAPPWPEMIAALASDPTPYDTWRSSNA